MRLCRWGKSGSEKPGMVDSDGRVRDLSKVVAQIGPAELSPRSLKRLAKIKPESAPKKWIFEVSRNDDGFISKITANSR